MSASVWSTESWTWAAICARSSARARAWRSAMRSRTRLSHHGPKMTTLAAMTRAAPPTGRSAATGRVALDQQRDAGGADEHAGDDAGDEPAAATAVGAAPNSGTTSLSMKAFSDSVALRQMRTTTPTAKNVGHPMRPTDGT